MGRRISELKARIDVHDIDSLLRDVIDSLTPREKRVRDDDGKQFLLRIRPYRTADNKIDGAVLTLLDLNEKMPNHKKARSAR